MGDRIWLWVAFGLALLLLLMKPLGPPGTEPFLDRSYAHRAVQDYTLDLFRQDQVRLENVRGVVEVHGWPERLLRLEVVKYADDPQTLKRIGVELRKEAASVRVAPTAPAAPGRLDYRVWVPFGVRLELRQEAGRIHLVGVQSLTEISVELEVGELELEGVKAPRILLRIGAGRVQLREVQGRVDLQVGGKGLHPGSKPKQTQGGGRYSIRSVVWSGGSSKPWPRI